MLLPTLLAVLGGATAPASAPACPKGAPPIEQLICSDSVLAQDDRDLVRLYTQAMQGFDETDRARQEARQRAWLAARNACMQAADPHACVTALYARRMIELKIRSGLLTSPATANYFCKGATAPVTAVYYPTEPPSALLTYADQQAVLFIAESGSGARYAAEDVEIWEHQGQATVKWNGKQLLCTKR
jgi:uncharacterized protein